MKKLFALILCILLVLTLASCGGDPCQHRDADDNSLCDNCGESYTGGKDVDDSTPCSHRDADDNSFCDNCGESYTDGKDLPDDPVHIHSYTQENTDGKYLATAADCKNVATYFYSCECGVVGEETFTYGDVKPHKFVDDNVCDDCGYSIYTSGLAFELNPDNASYRVIGIGNYEGDVIFVPPTYNGLPVTSIGDNAFDSCSQVTSVTLPDGIKAIGERAFRHCYNLVSINIPHNVNVIGSDAFFGCVRLRTLYVTDVAAWCNVEFVSVYSNPIYYTGGFYLNGFLVNNLVIPDGVSTISPNAFAYFIRMTSVTIPNSVTSIGDDAFWACDKLVEVINNSELNIVAGKTSNGHIADCAYEVHGGASKIVIKDGYLFYSYNQVNYLLGYEGRETELILPESYCNEPYEMYEYAFYKCKNITSVLIPSNLTSIGSCSFWDCSSLTNVIIENGVRTIGDEAFGGCYMTSIHIPDSVETIGEEAFSYCPNLTSVKVGIGLEEIGIRAFYGCFALTTINYYGTEEGWMSISKNTGWDNYTGDYTVVYNYKDQ